MPFAENPERGPVTISVIPRDQIAIPIFATPDNGPQSLSPREAQVLTLAAKGFSGPQIAARLRISDFTVNHHLDNSRVKLDTNTTPSAVAAAARRGDLDLRRVTPRYFRRSSLESLAPAERELFSDLTSNEGHLTYEQIAHFRETSVPSIKKRSAKLRKKLRARNRTHLVAIDLRMEKMKQLAHREIEVLRMVALGNTYGETGVNLGIAKPTVNVHAAKARAKLVVKSDQEAIIKAIDSGQIQLAEIIPPDFDPLRFDSLTSIEYALLESLVRSRGSKDSSAIGRDFSMAGSSVNRIFASIINKLGAKNRIQSVVLALERERRLMRNPAVPIPIYTSPSLSAALV